MLAQGICYLNLQAKMMSLDIILGLIYGIFFSFPPHPVITYVNYIFWIKMLSTFEITNVLTSEELYPSTVVADQVILENLLQRKLI